MVRRRGLGGPARETTVVVDAPPDFRLHPPAAGARRLDGLLLTHDHADQCHGIDDIRAFAITQRARIACWANEATAETLLTRFGYIFHGQGAYPAIADLHPTPALGTAWEILRPSGPIPVAPFDHDHGLRATSLPY